MSSANPPDATSKAAKKKKKSNKKKQSGKQDAKAAVTEVNGLKTEADADAEDDDEDDEGNDSPPKSIPNHVRTEDTLHMPSSPPEPTPAEGPPTLENDAHQPRAQQDTIADIEIPAMNDDLPGEDAKEDPSTSDTSSRLEAMQQERDNLRAEVTSLRRQLETIQKGRDDDNEVTTLRQELEQSQQGKEHIETQYRNLLGKVNTIRSQLGERLRADAEELEQARARIEELESTNAIAREENERLQDSMSHLQSKAESHEAEIGTLRDRTNLSTNNWVRERDELVSREAYIREEYEVAKQAMQDWEILATEERSRREALEEKTQELEEQLHAQHDLHRRVQDEADTQSTTVDGLQRALRELQEERKRELREIVEQSQTQLDELRKQTKDAEDSASGLQQEVSDKQKELDRVLPFEKEVREKNLLIGKLRHEAVILNDHLTKALRFLKRGKPEDNVDRQLVTNHFLHFLALDRSDPKKFQVLQLIAALLGWTEEQREQAGLVRQGSISGTGSLKLPVSPFRRTPSTPSLSHGFMPDASTTGTTKETLAELWSEFLEREAESGGVQSRRASTATSVRSPSIAGTITPLAGITSPSAEPLSPKIKRKESASAGSVSGSAGQSG